MTLSLLDVALPAGLAFVFALFRYSQYAKAGDKNAMPRAAGDGVKGAIGLAVLTLGYNYIMTR